jgi:hypothetical protein
MKSVAFERLKTAIRVTVPLLFAACGDLGPSGGSEDTAELHSELRIGPYGHSIAYTACANEYERCPVTGEKYLAYGANRSYLFRAADNPASNSIPCTSEYFGGDPAPGVVKKCYVSYYEYAVAEGFGGWTKGDVAYGANGIFNFKTVNDTYFRCDSETFGDPVPGVPKACYHGLPDYMMRASEGGTLTGLSNSPVAFGAHGKFFFKLASGTLTCGAEAFEGDPNSGIEKFCYKLIVPFYVDEGSRVNGGSIAYWYGSGLNGNFLAKNLPNNSLCANSTFGGDPHPGFLKHCF